MIPSVLWILGLGVSTASVVVLLVSKRISTVAGPALVAASLWILFLLSQNNLPHNIRLGLSVIEGVVVVACVYFISKDLRILSKSPRILERRKRP